MDEEKYLKLKTRLFGALNNAISKDPEINVFALNKAYREVCGRLIRKGKLKKG